MTTEMTFLKAMLTHLKLEGESLSDFRAQLGRLTSKDRDDLRAQFAREFGYTITVS